MSARPPKKKRAAKKKVSIAAKKTAGIPAKIDAPRVWQWKGQNLRFARDQKTIIQTIGLNAFTLGNPEGYYPGIRQDAQIHLWCCLATDDDLDQAIIDPSAAKVHVVRNWAPKAIESEEDQNDAIGLFTEMWSAVAESQPVPDSHGEGAAETPGKRQSGRSS